MWRHIQEEEQVTEEEGRGRNSCDTRGRRLWSNNVSFFFLQRWQSAGQSSDLKSMKKENEGTEEGSGEEGWREEEENRKGGPELIVS